MAEVIPSTSDFDALTSDYTPKVLVDNVFRATPVWAKFRQNMIKVDGRAWTPLIQYAQEAGEWYDPGDQLGSPTTPTAQISTRARFTLKFYRHKVLINAQDVDLQGTEAIVDLMKAHVSSATESMRQDLSAKLFSGNPAANPKQMDSLTRIVNDTNTCGELDPSSIAVWKAHIIEGTNTHATAVAPSINNLELLNRETSDTTGEAFDMFVVHGRYWDVLYGQLTRNEYLMGLTAHSNNDVVRWGFPTFFVDDVPVVRDRDCTGEAWVAGQANRGDAKGYECFGINFNHLKLAFNAKRSFKWEDGGWAKPYDYDQYLNKIYAWITIGTDARRTQGRIFNVDLAMDPTDWRLGTCTIPG